MRFNLSAKALTLIAIPLLMDLLLISTLFFSFQRADQEAAQLSNARSLVEVTDRISRLISDTAILTVRKSFGIDFSDTLDHLRSAGLESLVIELEKMEKLAAKSPARKQYMKAVTLARHSLKKFERLSQASTGGGINDAINCFREVQPEITDLLLITEKANEIESRTVKKAVHKEARTRSAIRNLISAGFVLNMIMAVLLTLVFNRGISRRLSSLMVNASKLPKGEPFTAHVGGGDEIGQLDLVLRTAAADLEQARKKERFLIDNMPVALSSLKEDGRIDLVNPAMETLFARSAQELQDMRLSDLLELNDEKELADGKPIEVKVRSEDGERFVELAFKVFENTKLAALIDITERLAIQRLRRQFVAMVSHDLRTPLTAVQASLELLYTGRYGNISEEGQKQLDRAERSVDRMILLINDLLDLEKLESASFTLHPATVNVSEVMERAFEAASVRADESGVKLEFERNDLKCWADSDRVIQVLINLVDNAIKFSQPGQTVTMLGRDAGNYVQLGIKDQGRGIPEEMREQIFERFVQVSKDDRKKRHGSGLGLAICKAIVQSHGGEIWVDSKPGEGSTFWFKLPKEEAFNGESSAR